MLFDLPIGDIFHYLNPGDLLPLAIGVARAKSMLKDWLQFGSLVWCIGFIEGCIILGAIEDYFYKERIYWFVGPKGIDQAK